jgi:peptidyl-prolyl cis-trans isomerase C
MAALPAVVLLVGGSAWAQSQTTPSHPKPAKPGDARSAPPAKPADILPTDPTPTSDSAPKPDDARRSPTDPVVAIVEGHMIYFSDLGRVVPTLPDNLRALPFQTLYPVALDRVIDHQALVAMARRSHLDEDPAVKRQIDAATDRILEDALLSRVVAPEVTEEQIQARYAKDYAGKPSTEQIRARHILVPTEEQAKQIIAELHNGADFSTLAKQYSKDPDGQNGGDLGFFRRNQVWPGFADVAFMLQPGQFSQTPVHNEFGWHVIKVEERRIVAPPSYSEVHDAIRKQLLQEAAADLIDQARGQLAIHKFNVDGTEMGALPNTSPPLPMVQPDNNSKQ